MHPFEQLANAIVLKGVADYRHALRKINRFPENEIYTQEINLIERFFLSSWFGFLTGLDPEVLIRKLCEEVA